MDDEWPAAGEEALEPGRHHARRRQRVREARADPAGVAERGAVPGAAALEDGDLGPARSELVGAAQPDDPAADDGDLHRRTLPCLSGRAADVRRWRALGDGRQVDGNRRAFRGAREQRVERERADHRVG